MNQKQTDITTGKQIRHLRTQSGMTQELFESIIDKCEKMETEVDSLFFRLLDEYPEFMDVRSSKIEEEVKKANLPPMEPEVAHKIKKRLDAKIEEYHRKNKE